MGFFDNVTINGERMIDISKGVSVEEIRTKTKRIFQEDELAGLVEDVLVFLSKPADDAMWLLWQFTYRDDILVFAEQAGFKSKLTENNVECFCNELRYQRKVVEENFMEISQRFTGNNIADAFLSHQLEDLRNFETIPDIERILFLLKSGKKEFVFGAIRSLRITKQGAEYLMKYVQAPNFLEKKLAEKVSEILEARKMDCENQSEAKEEPEEKVSYDESESDEPNVMVEKSENVVSKKSADYRKILIHQTQYDPGKMKIFVEVVEQICSEGVELSSIKKEDINLVKRLAEIYG